MLAVKLIPNKRIKELVGNDKKVTELSLLVDVIGKPKDSDNFFVVNMEDNRFASVTGVMLTSATHPLFWVPINFLDLEQGIESDMSTVDGLSYKEQKFFTLLESEYKSTSGKKLKFRKSTTVNVLNILECTANFINHSKKKMDEATSVYGEAIKSHLTLCEIFSNSLQLPNVEGYKTALAEVQARDYREGKFPMKKKICKERSEDKDEDY